MVCKILDIIYRNRYEVENIGIQNPTYQELLPNCHQSISNITEQEKCINLRWFLLRILQFYLFTHFSSNFDQLILPILSSFSAILTISTVFPSIVTFEDCIAKDSGTFVGDASVGIIKLIMKFSL